MQPTKIDFFLNHGGQLLARAESMLQLERILRQVVPVAFAKSCHAGNLKDGVLTLFADNGAVAAKLKQQRNSIQQKLFDRGVQVASIKIEVWVNKPNPPAPSPRKKMSAQGLASFRELEADLPDSDLKQAVSHLLRNIKPAGQR